MDHITARLEELSEMQAAVEVTRLDLEAKRAEILKSVQAELDALEEEYAPLLATAEARIEALKEEIKSDVLDHGGIRGFLKDDQIGCGGNDCFRNRLFPAQAAKPDVVTKQPVRHASSPGGITTKYGSPNNTSRP